LHKGTYMLTGL